jgi:hypothetical protein
MRAFEEQLQPVQVGLSWVNPLDLDAINRLVCI